MFNFFSIITAEFTSNIFLISLENNIQNVSKKCLVKFYNKKFLRRFTCFLSPILKEIRVVFIKRIYQKQNSNPPLN